MSSITSDNSRRNFLLQSFAGVSSAWVAANWPALLSAATHAREQAASGFPAKFEFFTATEAVEIDAMASRIIPTTDTPGAHEAGVVYFIDRALVTFAKDAQSAVRPGLAELQKKATELFPAIHKFSEATPDQQDQVLSLFDGPQVPASPQAGALADGGAHSVASEMGRDFFSVIRQGTIVGFLVDPDSRGNPNGVGWKVIGRERAHMFQPPFGYYDKDYPGWQPGPTERKPSGDL